MIRLERVRTAANIPASFRGAKRVQRERRLLTEKRDATLSFSSSQWKAAKDGLKAESRGKCAYCESRASAGYPCDVEHIRPKDLYWWLAWSYENYAFSCFLCNNKKSNQFSSLGNAWPEPAILSTTTNAQIDQIAGTLTPDPIDPAAGLTHAAYEARHRAEDADLPHPYLDDVAALLAFEADAVDESVMVVARPGSAASARVVEALERFCDINRDDVARDRYERYELMEQLATNVASNTLSPALQATTKATLRKSMDPRRPYSAMATFFIVDVWQLNL